MQREKPLPTQYHVEVYEGSFRNDPFWGIESSTPFPPMSVGEIFSTSGLNVALYDPPNKDQLFRIKDLQHLFWVIENSHIGHKLMICLELVERKS